MKSFIIVLSLVVLDVSGLPQLRDDSDYNDILTDLDDKEDILTAKEGYAMGLIMPPESERSFPESAAYIENLMTMRASVPPSYNAMDEGLVTPARSQEQCGSCAAFATGAVIETALLKAGAKLKGMDISEQYLVDCAYDGRGANGCNGAWPCAYPRWIADNGGETAHEVIYPYVGRKSKLTCPAVKTWSSGAEISRSIVEYRCDATKLKSLVHKHGAVLVAIDAGGSFGSYKGGVFKGCSSTQINHAVTVVGYGNEGGEDYWLVKNSWGKYWGDNGFIKMPRGSNACGIEKLCVTLEAKATGEAPDKVPTTPAPPPTPPKAKCNVSTIWGNLTGGYNLRYTYRGVKYESKVTCKKGVCWPRMPGPVNACEYICGQLECKR